MPSARALSTRPAAWVAALAGAAALAGGTPAHGQGTASIGAAATVTVAALSVGWNQELDFGTVTPGVPTTLDPQLAPTAGEFVVHGPKNAEIALTAVLPSTLTLGANSMPIAFGPAGACHRNRDQQDKCTYYDPSTVLVVRIRNKNPPDNTYFIWFGGTVSPGASQPGGTYTGSITLAAAFTGN